MYIHGVYLIDDLFYSIDCVDVRQLYSLNLLLGIRALKRLS